MSIRAKKRMRWEKEMKREAQRQRQRQEFEIECAGAAIRRQLGLPPGGKQLREDDLIFSQVLAEYVNGLIVHSPKYLAYRARAERRKARREVRKS